MTSMLDRWVPAWGITVATMPLRSLASAQGIATETDRDHGQGQEGEDSEDPPAPALELAAPFPPERRAEPDRGRTSAQLSLRRRGYCTLLGGRVRRHRPIAAGTWRRAPVSCRPDMSALAQ